jgi:hypothetical protein
MNLRILLVIIFTFIFLATITALLFWSAKQDLPPVTTYEECVARGYPILESYPEQCKTPEGATFVRQIPAGSNEDEEEITGEIICLPYKDQNSPHTLECAIGLKNYNGDNYALKFPDNAIIDYPVGSNYTFRGTIKSSAGDPMERYDIKGVFTITGVIKE